ncbi:MAG: hypothetical protein CM1200mP26_13530 [Acidimicrobiales bacterium]|nr:MAG: hypothetical protein CM1200mP26_13530 [Acidimicrobiales bacterium]
MGRGHQDDYADAEPGVMLTVEEVGRPGQGLVGHLSPDIARRPRGGLSRMPWPKSERSPGLLGVGDRRIFLATYSKKNPS